MSTSTKSGSSKKRSAVTTTADVMAGLVLPVGIVGIIFVLLNGGDKSTTLMKKERIIAKYHQPSTSKKDKIKLFWALFLKNIKGRGYATPAIFLFVMNFLKSYADVYGSNDYVLDKNLKEFVKSLLIEGTTTQMLLLLIMVLRTHVQLNRGVDLLPQLRTEAFRKGMTREEAQVASREELITFVHGDVRLSASQRRALSKRK